MNTEKMKKAPVTSLLIVVCIGVYLCGAFVFKTLSFSALEAYGMGAYYAPAVAIDHEYWRLFTANFLHYNLMHLVMNLYALWSLGYFCERVLRRRAYLIVLLVAALTTSGLAYVFYIITGIGGTSVSAGISGVIFGLIGAVAALSVADARRFKPVWNSLAPSVGLMLALGILVPSISFSGHVCGFAGGFVSAYAALKMFK